MYQRILVAVDGSTGSTLALQEALELAGEHQARLRLVHVMDADLYRHVWGKAEALEQAWRETGQRFLDQAAALARQAGVEPDAVLLENDGRRISNAIVDEARNWPADLIVVGTHGRHGLDHLMLGSVAEGVLRAASVPVLVVRGQ